MGLPQNGWFIGENQIEMDDLGLPLSQETSRYLFIDSQVVCVHIGIQDDLDQNHPIQHHPWTVSGLCVLVGLGDAMMVCYGQALGIKQILEKQVGKVQLGIGFHNKKIYALGNCQYNVCIYIYTHPNKTSIFNSIEWQAPTSFFKSILVN